MRLNNFLKKAIVIALVIFLLNNISFYASKKTFDSYLRKVDNNKYHLIVKNRKILEIRWELIDLKRSYITKKFSSKISLGELGQCYALIFNFSKLKVTYMAVGAKEEEIKIYSEGIVIEFFDIKEQLGYKFEENDFILLVKPEESLPLLISDENGEEKNYFLYWNFDSKDPERQLIFHTWDEGEGIVGGVD